MREITDRGRIGCVVTRYFVSSYGLVEQTTEEDTSYRVEGDYLYLGNSEASALVENLEKLARDGQSWSAQAGTPPVRVGCSDPSRYMECCGPGGCQAGWGGRNYPKIVVPATELRRVLGVEVSS